MPESLRKDNLDEITAQPLLNYLVALSLSRGNLDFSTETNLNAIYQDLLEAIYVRGWEGRRHLGTQGLEQDDFFRILEEIALATWHGDGRTTTIRNIESHCQHSGLQPLLENFQEGAKAGVTRLLTAFYFRQSGLSESGDKTFEFTHKSFGEYLTARRIIRATRRIHDNLEKRKVHYEEGWDESQCLEEWAKLCGPSVMDTYLFSFVCDEARLQGKATTAKWQQSLSHLIGFMLRNGMPMERLTPRVAYQEESRQARNAEESLLVMLNACARQTHALSKIEWIGPRTFTNWIKRIQDSTTLYGSLVLECLSYLDLNNCLISCLHLPYANLSNSDLSQSHIDNTNFTRANLRNTSFKESFIILSDMILANLENTDMQDAHIAGTDFRWAYLERANFQNAHLTSVGLSSKGAEYIPIYNDLRYAILKEANLRDAHISGADFRGADLETVNFGNAKFIQNKKEEQFASDILYDSQTRLPLKASKFLKVAKKIEIVDTSS